MAGRWNSSRRETARPNASSGRTDTGVPLPPPWPAPGTHSFMLSGPRDLFLVQVLGQVAILEFSMPRWQPFKGLYGWYFRHVLPRLGQLLARNREEAYSYLPDSVGEFPSGDALAQRMRQAGLQHVRFQPQTLGIAITSATQSVNVYTHPTGSHRHVGSRRREELLQNQRIARIVVTCSRRNGSGYYFEGYFHVAPIRIDGRFFRLLSPDSVHYVGSMEKRVSLGRLL